MGLRGFGLAYPHADKRRGAPGDACGIVSRPLALDAASRPLNTGLTGRAGGVWGGATVPRVVAPGRATASGNATPKHGARVALGAYMGASPHPPFPLVSSREGCRRWPSRPWREGVALPGVWGCNPLPWSRHRRRAGRLRVQGAAPGQTVSRSENIVRSKFRKTPPYFKL